MLMKKGGNLNKRPSALGAGALNPHDISISSKSKQLQNLDPSMHSKSNDRSYMLINQGEDANVRIPHTKGPVDKETKKQRLEKIKNFFNEPSANFQPHPLDRLNKSLDHKQQQRIPSSLNTTSNNTTTQNKGEGGDGASTLQVGGDELAALKMPAHPAVDTLASSNQQQYLSPQLSKSKDMSKPDDSFDMMIPKHVPGGASEVVEAAAGQNK